MIKTVEKSMLLLCKILQHPSGTQPVTTSIPFHASPIFFVDLCSNTSMRETSASKRPLWAMRGGFHW